MLFFGGGGGNNERDDCHQATGVGGGRVKNLPFAMIDSIIGGERFFFGPLALILYKEVSFKWKRFHVYSLV